MYDFVKIWMPTSKSIKYDKLENINQFANTETAHISTYSKLNNLNIAERNEGLQILGSLPYYFLGNNVQTLRRKDTKLAIEKLQDDLGINLSRANVYRIDFASNFIMNHPYQNYFDLLIDAPYTLKGYIDDSVYFQNEQRKMVFYGKIQEMKDKKIPIPERFLEFKETMLRYELRYKTNLKEQVKQSVKVTDLYDYTFFSKMINRWKQNYYSINKQQKINLESKTFSTTKDFIEFLALNYIIEKGVDDILNVITSNSSKFNRPVEVSRTKRKIKELISNKKFSIPNELIQELDKKVNENAEYFLQ